MTSLDDSFPEYPNAPRAQPAETPVAEHATTEPTPPVSPPAPVAADPAPIPSASPAPTLITPEQIAEISSDITEDIVDAMTEKENISKDIPNEAGKENDSSTNVSTAHHTSVVIERIVSTPEVREAALRARIEKREAKLIRIIESARHRGSIRNDDIEKILHISNATATRYAQLLVQRGELIRTEKGRNIRYSPRS